MNFPLLVARRYLFAKRSTNAINIITGISVLGVAIGTAALILVLSVFNGFEDLLSGLFGYFNPEVKVVLAKGKTFVPDSARLVQLRGLPGVWRVSESIEETAMFQQGDAVYFGVMKGVDSLFAKVTGLDSTVVEGSYRLQEEDRNCAVIGVELASKLGVNVHNPIAFLRVFMPTDQSEGALSNPYKARLLYPAGVFAIQQEYDNQYILSNIEFVRELLEAPDGAVSALEIKCASGANMREVKKRVQALMGPDFTVKDRYEQNEAFFKVMQLEKWMGYAITSLMLILMAFNTIGALWMIVLDKQKDISTLKSLGATDGLVRRIFLLEGLLLTLLGMGIGMVLAVILYFIQKYYGLITIPEGFLVNTYPITMRPSHFIPVTVTVLGIGLLAALAPARRAVQVSAFLREE